MLRSFKPAAMEADTGWPLRLQSLFVVLFGILVDSSLIGLIASGIERRVEELRMGRSEVLEEGHVLIVGWSEGAPGLRRAGPGSPLPASTPTPA